MRQDLDALLLMNICKTLKANICMIMYHFQTSSPSNNFIYENFRTRTLSDCTNFMKTTRFERAKLL